MRIVEKYSHLNGEEFLLVHKPKLWQEVLDVIKDVDAEACRTKVSEEKQTAGKILYSPPAMNAAMAEGFEALGWAERRQNFWVTADADILRGIVGLDPADQRKRIEEAGHTPIRSYNQTDFVKARVAVEYNSESTPSSPMTYSSSTWLSSFPTSSTSGSRSSR